MEDYSVYDVIGPVDEERCLLIGHLNVRSLNAHIVELREIAAQNNFDVIAITETWLSQMIPTESIELPGYHMIRLDRSSNILQRGGGIAIYIREAIRFNADIMLDPGTCIHTDLEQLWIRITLHGRIYGVGVIYRRPQNSLASLCALENAISSILPLVSDMIIVGDININLLDRASPGCLALEGILNFLSLKQLIREPTRVTDTTATLLDVAIVSSTSRVLRAGTVPTYGFTDHALIYCALECQKAKVMPKFHVVRDFKNIDMDALDKDANAVDWTDITRYPNIDDKVQFLSENVSRICEHHAPVRIIRTTKMKAPWFTKAIDAMIKKRNSLWTRCRKTKLDADWDAYRRMRNVTLTAIRKEKQAYVTYKLKKLRSREFWYGVRSIGIHKAVDTVLPARFVDPSAINDYLLDNLPRVTVDPAEIELFHSSLHPNVTEPFVFKMVSVKQVNDAIYSIKGRAAGCDGISGNMMLLLIRYCLPAMTHIINSSFEMGSFPVIWKNAIIHPIPKVPEPHEPADLRPISILCFMSKVLERLCFEQMNEHFTRLRLLPDLQSGFRKGFSTTTALLKVSDDILRASDKSCVTALVLLDFSRAFDTLNHALLLAKLFHYGFDMVALAWMQDYLTNRTQQVQIGNTAVPSISPPRLIEQGVPQGSILGPLLFSIYSADLIKVLEHTLYHMYADDLQMYVSFRPDESEANLLYLNQDLENVAGWAAKNSLRLNVQKCVALLVGNRDLLCRVPPNFGLQVGGLPLVVKQKAKNLGLYVEDDWSFQEHIHVKCQAAYSRLRALYPFRRNLPSSVKLRLAEALVLSQLDYCDVVYGPCLAQSGVRRIQMLQNSCLRFAYGVRKYDHISSAMALSGWLSMDLRRLARLCCMVHKVMLTGLPPYLRDLIRRNIENHARNSLHTRNDHMLAVPRYRTSKYQGSFSYSAAVIYNALPEYMKSLSLGAFKIHIKHHFGGSDV